MKIMTKEICKYNDILFLKFDLQGYSSGKMPIFILDGEDYNINDMYLNTLKTNYNNFSEKENQLKVIFVPDSLECVGNKKRRIPIKNSTTALDFQESYVNRLRAISYLPESLLTQIKDKRLFALGYADSALWSKFTQYVNQINKKLEEAEKKYAETFSINYDLTITAQIEDLKEYFGEDSIQLIMDERDITDFYFKKKNLYIEAEDITLILKNAIKIVEECDPKNTHFQALEIYPIENGFELHLLLRKTDSNLIDDYYYVTYSFDDMALIRNNNKRF